MAFGKWIGGIVGFMQGGPLGALAGIVLGGVFDTMLNAVNTPETQGTSMDRVATIHMHIAQTHT